MTRDQLIIGIILQIILAPIAVFAEDATTESDSGGFRLQYSGYIDESFRETQFFQKYFDNDFFVWDTRLELLPNEGFTFGPYARFAGNLSGHDDSGNSNAGFENGLTAAPGGGFEVYPFSLPDFNNNGNLNVVGYLFGPMRLFGEYNVVDYQSFGEQNGWRPRRQVRAGFDYFATYNVADIREWLWVEPYASVTFQSSNEFDNNYDGTIFGTSLRSGVRIPNDGIVSWISPYVVEESSITSHPGYAFENYCHLGGGIRLAVPVNSLPRELRWINRIVFYVEYLDRVDNLHSQAPGTPNYEWRGGINFAFGQYFFNM